MKKRVLVLSALLLTVIGLNAQTKVFKEVAEGISTHIESIKQDGALIGYLSFTQLEEASADSFNYRINLMDENLNEIGKVEFRDYNLQLYSVSFEQDVLCLAYAKSNLLNKKYRYLKTVERNGVNQTGVLYQFINLEGKILNSYFEKADVVEYDLVPTTVNRGVKLQGYKRGWAFTLSDIQLKNLNGQGFVSYYRTHPTTEKEESRLIMFDAAGKKKWVQTQVKADMVHLHTAKNGAYLLCRNGNRVEDEYELYSISSNNGKTAFKYPLKDSKGRVLQVLTIDNDPVSGNPYLAGTILKEGFSKGYGYVSPQNYASGMNIGVFNIGVDGPDKKSIHPQYSYWNDGSKEPVLSKKGRINQIKSNVVYSDAFRTANGDTYFAGPGMSGKVAWGRIGLSVLTLPTIVYPALISIAGYNKFKLSDAAVLKLDAKGNLTVANSIPSVNTAYFGGGQAMSLHNNKVLFHVRNASSNTDNIVLRDQKNITIYNVNTGKVVRKLPVAEDKNYVSVFPAKEGHIMIYENNVKEKYTRLSIESL